MTPDRTALPGWGVALGIHGLVLAVLFSADPKDAPRLPKRPPVKVRLVQRPKPIPPPAPKPEPARVEPKPEPAPAPETPVKKAPPRRAPRRQKAAPPPAPAPAPPPAETPAPPRPVKRFAISMEATVSSGGVAVPVASDGRASAVGAVGGDPNGALRQKKAPTPAPAAPARTGPARVITAAEATRLPRLLGRPSSSELRRAYPAGARRDGLEGDVKLKILVSSDGLVEQVRILRRAGNGFDEAAVALVKKFRFEPGSRGGRKVAVWIPWTYKFRLNG